MIIIWFLILLTVIVFIHEMGHYLIARINGVKVEVFSIGFGKEIFGYDDKHGTKWKICLIPLGGYVKFFGDANLSSNIPDEELKSLSAEDINKTFHIKSIKQKASIVFAGPLANFIFSFLIFFILMSVYGVPENINYLPIVDKVNENSAASKAGFRENDVVIMVNNKNITNFFEIRDIIVKNPLKDVSFKVLRADKVIPIIAKPDLVEVNDGNEIKKIGRMGFSAKYETIHKKLTIKEAVLKATSDTYVYTIKTFEGITDIVSGKRSASELGGPIMIASVASKAANTGIESYMFIMAIISINLGLINLLPIPLLDGGHLLLYGIQSISKSVINEVFLKYYYGLGLFIIFCLMILVNYNDLVKQIN
jgi:regulator of sigma E protease